MAYLSVARGGVMACLAFHILFQAAIAGETASAPSAPSPSGPYASVPEAFRDRDGTTEAMAIRLGPLEASAVAQLKDANDVTGERRLRIGVGRELAGLAATSSANLKWSSVAGGLAARWHLVSSGAAALRVALDAQALPAGAELRLSGADGVVYGPFGAADVLRAGRPFWSPVIDGDAAEIEIYVPFPLSRDEVSVSLAGVSHLLARPQDANPASVLKASGTCEVDVACRSNDTALVSVARSVARMTFVDGGTTYLCTGTLMNTTSGPGAAYFLTDNVCISTQAAASTLTTHWFYDATACSSGVVNPGAVQVAGGATLLYTNSAGSTLLQLNGTLPGAVWYSGWSSAVLPMGTALTGVHHPQGDVKKVSVGTMTGYATRQASAGYDHLIVTWNDASTGVTEPGSGGSAVFTKGGTPPDYFLRGTLSSGYASCSATGLNLRDFYSRFDVLYPSIARYLNPSQTCTFAISPGSAKVGGSAASGTFTVTTPAGCGYAVLPTVAWISATVGSGGVVTYTVSANSGDARSGALLVGTQTFTITQQAGSDAGANMDFEAGHAAWVEASTGGYLNITNDATLAHSGSWYGWLGGYTSGTDTLHQDIAIPQAASRVQLTFWYSIATRETTPAVHDLLTVQIVNPANGAAFTTLAVLSNANATGGWVQSPTYDLSAYSGQTVRLKFTATNDAASFTNFFIDDVSVRVTMPTALSNISTRGLTGTGNNVLIGGFVVGGGASKTVVVTATGPSLTQYGIANPLPNPTLTLVRSLDQTVIAANDDWAASADAWRIQAAGFAPAHRLESAIMATLPPGAYTAIVSDAGGSTGVGVVAVYEIDHSEVPLVNISTRGQVLTANDVMIGGFVIQGTAPQTVIVTGTGPSLVNYGITNPVPNPKLTLVRSLDQAVLAINDNWGNAPNAAQIQSAGFAPSNPLESAIMITLPPGAYTAILEGVGGGTGVGVVAVYRQ